MLNDRWLEILAQRVRGMDKPRELQAIVDTNMLSQAFINVQEISRRKKRMFVT